MNYDRLMIYEEVCVTGQKQVEQYHVVALWPLYCNTCVIIEFK